MTSEGAELDLYADDIGDEFSQENEFNDSDLYDDVITSNSKARVEETQSYNGNSSQSQNSNVSNNSQMLSIVNTNNHNMNSESNSYVSNKRPSIYVGNLTWWTTDEDVIRALSTVNVSDVVEVKFFENRANGQSKGFCVVSFSGESSVRAAIEKLPKSEIHGQNPAVTMCNRQNLNNFEMKSRKPGQNGQPNNGNGGNSNGGNMGPNNSNYIPHRNFQNQNMPSGNRPPLIQRPMRPSGPLLSSQPRIPQLSHQTLSFGAPNPPQWSQMLQNGPRPQLHPAPGAPALNPMLRLQPGRQLSNQPLLSAPSNQNDLRSQLSSVPGLSVPGQHSLNASHMNPSLFPAPQGFPPSISEQFVNRLGPMAPYASGHPSNEFARSQLEMGLQMSEAEFEEILSKNKNLANNTISRAVSDASSGDYSAAIDTLSTAISLIKQSRVAHDERCKVIIASLHDTLQSIESKAYSSGGDRSRRERPRSRDRSRERSSRRDKIKRERSRSREREYRERSRDRYHEDRYHEEPRYREKESDRDRERDRDRHRDHRSSRH